jgi:hypothetical protein
MGRRRSGDHRGLEIEVEDVDDLEVGAVHQDQVAAYKDMHVTGRRRRQEGFDLMRTRLHSASEFDRDESLDDDLTLQPGRKMVASGQPWRQVVVICPIPFVQVAIMLGVVMIPAAVVVMSIVVVGVIMVVMPVVFTIAVMVVLLGECDGRRENQRQHSGRSETKEGPKGHRSLQ